MAIKSKALELAARKLSSHMMVAIIIVVLVGFMGLFIWQALQIRGMEGEFNAKKAELTAVEQTNTQLQEHLDFYKGPGYLLYVEKVAREALGLIKPGETVVLTVPDTDQPGVTAPNGTKPVGNNNVVATPKKKPNWRNWLDFFIGT